MNFDFCILNLSEANMWNTIKQILKKQPGTCIIVEEGKPAYVITSFADYERLLDEQSYRPASIKEVLNEHELLEKINQEIGNWKTKQVEEAPELAVDLPEDDEVKIEDLPLA
ncbi:MAG TPA: hypothetical protein DHI91_00635 [Candidatus Portnoybacteria bacterium]|nr:hypothetical protein [Candidatus Portnoybacteria bacterium]